MSNYHFKEKGMSLKAKGLLSLMLSLPDDWNYSISGLVRLSKDGKDSVMSALSELEKFGYLMRERTKDENGKFNGIVYHIFEEPQTEFPITEKPILENAKAGKPISESPPQLNTKKLNIKENKILYDINNYIDILETIPDDHLRNLYCSFLENRYQMGDPLTTKGLKLLIERVRTLVGIDIERQKELLKNAIINNWKNVYVKEEHHESEIINNLKSFYEQ
jgi:hypothetical protein